jgi:integrase
LCPRALAVLKSHLTLRSEWVRAGKIHHAQVFIQDSGEPIRLLNYPYERWRHTLQSLQLRYRKPYCARHSSVSWNLMIGKNPLWVAKQHGPSVTTMFRVYSAWAEGAEAAAIQAIKRAMKRPPAPALEAASRPPSPQPVSGVAGLLPA